MGKPEAEATRLLQETGLGRELPVDVGRIAAYLGAQVIEERLVRGPSGLLYRDGDQVVIGVNSSHAERRRRFTVAHEIGHLVLHKGRTLILDRANFRDATSSTATNYEEIQANAFAAELLMPRAQVYARQGGRARDADLVRDLADTFKVSEQAMGCRLVNLGLRIHA